MSRYRKVDPRIWNDERFRELSDDGQLVFLFLMTHPFMTALGAMRATLPGLAAEKGWTPERFREAFGQAFRKGMVEHDEKACLIALPRFLKYNPPESPNVVKAWIGSVDLLPECALKTLVLQRAKAFAEGMGKAFGEAFGKAMPKTMPYQEQEQEQEQKQEDQEQRRDDARPDDGSGDHDNTQADGKKGKRAKGEDEPPPVIPEWMPMDAWNGYLVMRAKIRAPMTNRAKRLAIEFLDSLRGRHAPQTVLDKSTQEGWRGLFDPDDKAGGKAKAQRPNGSVSAGGWRNTTKGERADGSVSF